MTTQLSGRLVLRCDVEGRMLSSVGSTISVPIDPDNPRPLPLWVDRASAAKCERFLARVRSGGAFGWELCVTDARGTHSLLFAGRPTPERELSIVAAESAWALLRLLDAGPEAPPLAPQHQDPADAGPRSAPAEREAGPAAGFLMSELTRVNSELLCLQRDLAKRNAELAALTKQRNELLASAAHDLRNPLLVMQGYCDLLGLGVGLTQGTQRELLEQVQDASELMLHILEDTLEYARLENGRILPHPVEVDLAALTLKAVQAHQPMAQRKQIELVVDSPVSLPHLRLDATHLQQVIGNLLSNAIKYSHPGGRVDVVLSRDGDQLQLSVQDRGQGINASELPLLFQPFQTTSARPTAGEPSTGLGLAIARRLVEASGGQISVRSAPDEGSTFSVRLPLPPAGSVKSSREVTKQPRPVRPNRHAHASPKRPQN
ncbi:MAG TPA: HAMP domain-containing sensor histidine kinase [Polyangiales bacterium]